MQWEPLKKVLSENAFNIASIAITLLVAVAGLIVDRKLRRFRYRKAKESLIDLLEGELVGGVSVDETKLRALFKAIEREAEVDLAGDYAIEDWMGDVLLRFEKSRHLSAGQKQTYYQSMRSLSEEVRVQQQGQKQPTIPRKFSVIIADLEESLKPDSPKGEQALRELEQLMSDRFAISLRSFSVLRVYRNPTLAIAFGMVSGGIFALVVRRLLDLIWR